MPRLTTRILLRTTLVMSTLAAAAPRMASAENAPAFQVVDPLGTAAVVSPSQVLALPRTLAFDPALPDDPSYVSWSGLARDPITRTVYLVGADVRANASYLTRVDLVTGAQVFVGTIPGELVVDLAADGAGYLYGLTDNTLGAHPHALLSIDAHNAANTLVKVLDAHGGGVTVAWFGTIAWNAVDGSLYYAGNDASQHLFLDRLLPGTWSQTHLLTSTATARPTAMTITEGRVWIVAANQFLSATAASPADLVKEPQALQYSTFFGPYVFSAFGMLPADLPCLPSATAACLADRFRVEVRYDALPGAGAGPANVVLESAATAKFTFFDAGNIELIVKVLDACASFHRWWVFAGGLTNVGVTVTVTDTANGQTKTYTNAKGQLFQAFADTAAFACP